MENSLSIVQKVLLGRLAYSLGINYMSNEEYDDLVYNQLSPYSPFRYLNTEDIPQTLIDELLCLGVAEGLTDIAEAYKCHMDKLMADSVKAYSSDAGNGTGANTAHLRSMFPQSMSMQMAKELSVITDNYLPQLLDMYYQVLESDVLDKPTVIETFYAYKKDGWNISGYYDPSDTSTLVLDDSGVEYVKMKYAHSRGSDGAIYTDCTDMMQLLTPCMKRSELRGLIMQVTGELTMYKQYLDTLNKALDRNYQNVRNTMSGFVKGTIPSEYYYMIQFSAFRVRFSDNTTVSDTVSGVYQWLTEHNFICPPCNLVQSPILGTKEETKEALLQSFHDMFVSYENYYKTEYCKIHECDGVTLQPNLFTLSKNMTPVATGNFGYGLVAIKAGIWYKKDYTSVIKRIHFSKSRADRVPMATVEPVRSDLGQNMTSVPLLHIDNVRENDIRVGDKITFTYHSQQIVEFKKNLSFEERKRKRKAVVSA